MRWLLISLSMAIVAVIVTLVIIKEPSMSAPERPKNIQLDRRVVRSINDLGFRLFAELGSDEDNVFISPPSIELALAMTYNGAGGATKEAMAKVMGVNALSLEELNKGNTQLLSLLKNPDPKVELAIANSLWGRQGIAFKQDFLERVGASYQAKLATLNFAQPQAADTINQWVSDNTRGKIPTLVNPPMLQDALLVLVNAIYFKGAWTAPFEKELTEDGPFTLADGKQKTLPMMQQRDEFRYFETEAFQAISLPYGDTNVTMDIFLPKPGIASEAFRKSMTAENWGKWAAKFRSREGALTLPRFKAKYETGLRASLSALGMGVAFTENADFRGMLADETIRAQITDAIHKTVLEVNEEGTVAAGVTGVVVGITSMPADGPFTMTVDRPFFLAIRDNPTGAMLFMGMINNPE